MKKKPEYLLLAFIGALMVLMATYIQWTSMDLGRYGIGEYVVADLGRWAWWSTLGIPFLLGITYLGAAIFGLRANLGNRSALILFGGCFVAGCVLAIVSGFGYFAAIATGVCLASVAYDKKPGTQ